VILGISVQSVFSFHMYSVLVFFCWHVCNLYLLNNQAMFGLLSTNVAIDKDSVYRFQVTAVLPLAIFLELLSGCAVI